MFLIVVGCGAEQTEPPTSTTSAPVATTITGPVDATLASTSTTETATTTTAPGSAPAGLRGMWAGTTPQGDAAQLTLAGVNYTAVISSGGGRAEGAGQIFVDGDTIVFINPNPTFCSGEGRGEYLWSVDDGVLRFEPTATDECPPRVPHLIDIEYTLVDPLDY
ncbi:MAG TPA: hypothetical protein VJ948_02855 [Acidimicrobiia bacterium]|nr:hypothetical protein [Acidimicrobiia bacterium]